ncbi:hypothetical protein J2S25_001176 [Mesobacillus stamsii]|uniref:Uncharacterized protein n=1 Tax=Mesobacillus stamsii TaxID=225347 RepID=A0ABU0FSV5_9BACI|nr:hypothetical protein [Mesobacillus stamsii]
MEPNILKRIFFVDRHEGEKRLEELAANGLPKRRLCANAGKIYFDRFGDVERKVVKKALLF